MSYVMHSNTAGPAALNPMRRLAVVLRDALRTMVQRMAARRRYAAARREFERLDDASLRDLGISRNEFDSYWAESLGHVEQSRRRVMQHLHGSPL